MLYDSDRPKISETAQHQIEETRIEKITALTVTKFGTGQFAQRGREITPGIGIGNWIERKRKALPDRPGKDECDRSPITKSAKANLVPGRNDCLLASCAIISKRGPILRKSYGLSPAPVG